MDDQAYKYLLDRECYSNFAKENLFLTANKKKYSPQIPPYPILFILSRVFLLRQGFAAKMMISCFSSCCFNLVHMCA